MTATQQATQQILLVTGQETASESVKKDVETIVERYWGAKGTMAKGLAVGLITDALGVKYGEYSAKIATQLP